MDIDLSGYSDDQLENLLKSCQKKDPLAEAEKALDDADYWGSEPNRGVIREAIREAKRMRSDLARISNKDTHPSYRLEIVVRDPMAKEQIENLCASWHRWKPNSCYIDSETSE